MQRYFAPYCGYGERVIEQRWFFFSPRHGCRIYSSVGCVSRCPGFFWRSSPLHATTCLLLLDGSMVVNGWMYLSHEQGRNDASQRTGTPLPLNGRTAVMVRWIGSPPRLCRRGYSRTARALRRARCAKKMRIEPNGHLAPRGSFIPTPATALTPTKEMTREGGTQPLEAAAPAAASTTGSTPGESMPGSDSAKRAVPEAGARTGKRRAVCATPPSSEDEEQADQPPMARPCKQKPSQWTKTTTRCGLYVETKVASKDPWPCSAPDHAQLRTPPPSFGQPRPIDPTISRSGRAGRPYSGHS